jgi:4a-hydroxytetrahydrobiopterin dehydratase
VERLDDSALNAALAGLDWARRGEAIFREFDRGDFAGAIALVDQVANEAERRNHHPDIAVSWSRVTFVLSTHSAGGITQADIDLARAIDDIAGA